MDLPLCDVCGERVATVYIQLVSGDVQQEKRLCARCAAAQEMNLLPFTLDISSDSDDQINISLRQTEPAPGAAAARDLPDERCPECGTTSHDVAAKGLVGCPKCYDSLPATVGGLVATVQPPRSAPVETNGEPSPEISSLARLQLQLAEAVGNEDYECAARLWNIIRQRTN